MKLMIRMNLGLSHYYEFHWDCMEFKRKTK
jgi:hypothetical protein